MHRRTASPHHRIQFSYVSWNFRLKRITTVLLKIPSFQYHCWREIQNRKFTKSDLPDHTLPAMFMATWKFSLTNYILEFFLFQLHIRALSTSELIAAFESIRHTTEEEILPKLNKKKSDREMLEGLAKKTFPRNFLSIPIKNLTSITDELIV